MSAMKDLIAFQRETEALGQISGRLEWDQETMMPSGAATQRGEELAALQSVLHARKTDPRLGDWLEAAQPETKVETAILRDVRKSYDRMRKVPAELDAEIALVMSKSQGVWAEARSKDDFGSFVPTFERVVALKREEGQALANGTDKTVYDAMLDDYEPDATALDMAVMFDEMRPTLVSLREAVLAAEPAPVLDFDFDEAGQLEISNKLAQAFGYDFTKGRIDKAVHPFSSGSGTDVRITTRTSARDPFNCFYSTIHEVGHACYEQGIDDAYFLTPLGQGVSMGVHESQSRIYENQLGRSRAFTGYLYGLMRDQFGDFGIANEDIFYRAVNAVNKGYIRTEADELQYNLHVMLRFELEQALMAGDLQVVDLETAWNEAFKRDFGYEVDKPSNGVLQDVHWPVGLFGYFPTYSLGNLYAGCLYEALKRGVPTLEADLSKGEVSNATNWLRGNLQHHGGLRTPVQTIEHACGTPPSAQPLMTYLTDKFKGLYSL